MCLAWAPAMLGKLLPPGPAGIPAVPAWHDRQVPAPVPLPVGFPAVWHTAHAGAPLTGLLPDAAWQLEQSFVNAVAVAVKCPFPRKGTAWLGWPGPLAWQATPFAVAEKQLGAVASGAVRPLVTSWQRAQATARLPASRWDEA